MDSDSSPFNPLGRRADLIIQERFRYYRGCARIEIRHLEFDNEHVLGSRPLDADNVNRLVKIFNIEGCSHFEPEHRVAAIISEEILIQSLIRSNTTQEALFDIIDPPTLFFEENTKLLCPYGKHRLKAAEEFGENWWLVELYLDGTTRLFQEILEVR